MRQVRYNVAASLDGCIAGPGGEFDWIPFDPTVDFGAVFARVDTVLLGRRSYETVRESRQAPWAPNTRVYVFSSTLDAAQCPGATLVRENAGAAVAALRAEQGSGEIWLFGGGTLFRSLLDQGQVDTIEVTIVPVLLGNGVPLLERGPVTRAGLVLRDTRQYPSGMVTLSYSVPGSAPVPDVA